ncbi:hypothetical protein Ahy_B03g066240 [Arachis hypogaea]|uniref:Uncharacterized protein n=1 Tax=Arachis hypogaea TaxID=3818 RepID=A0A445A3K2_ARAHY|nr:hypothetical protein Ahy_B03g066240 [Arachis hypogaea]
MEPLTQFSSILLVEILGFDLNVWFLFLVVGTQKWSSKYNELNQDLAEVKDALEREKSAHLIVISEAKKWEEHLRKALGVEKECVLDLEKVVRKMRSEHANIKFFAESKLAEANALVASIEEKSLEVEAKLRSVNAKLAEISIKSSEIDKKSHDLESQKALLRRDCLSLIADRQEAHESTLSKQGDDLREWERNCRRGKRG